MLGRVVGVSGYAQSGKDTVGEYLVEKHGYERIAFADKVREATVELIESVYFEEYGMVDLKDIFYGNAYEDLKKRPEVRNELVRVAETMRSILGPSIWAEPVIQEIRKRPYKRFVVTDVRKPEEANLLHHYFHTTIIGVSRPGIGPAEEVEAKSILGVPVDFALVNNGDIKKLHKAIDDLMIKGYLI
jgi:dephospho-CoA kinase